MTDAAQELLDRITPLVKDPELAAWLSDELIRCRAQAEQLRELREALYEYSAIRGASPARSADAWAKVMRLSRGGTTE